MRLSMVISIVVIRGPFTAKMCNVFVDCHVVGNRQCCECYGWNSYSNYNEWGVHMQKQTED